MQADVPTAPPPVAMSHGQVPPFLSKYPHIQQDGVSYAILQITITANRAALDDASVKLKAEGWTSDLQQTRGGSTVLAVGLEKRTADESIALMRRLAAGEFGNVKAEPMALPDATR